jgi:hypothetical protein
VARWKHDICALMVLCHDGALEWVPDRIESRAAGR